MRTAVSIPLNRLIHFAVKNFLPRSDIFLLNSLVAIMLKMLIGFPKLTVVNLPKKGRTKDKKISVILY